ncbi:MAG: CvpA family protein [Pseudomonadota bacterium]
MNWLDIVSIVIVAISMIFGLKRGLIKEIFTLLALILGVVVATRVYSQGAEILGGVIHNPNAAKIVSFIVIFFLVAALLTVIGIFLRNLIRLIQLGWIDRLGGTLFGFLRGAIIVGVGLVFITRYPILGSEKWVQGASLAPFFLNLIESLWKLVPPDLLKSMNV